MKALHKNTDTKEFELILIDNASTTKEAKTIESLVREYNYFYEDNEIKLIKNKKMKSFAENCNMGAKISEANYLMFLNDDTEVQPGWLTALVDSMNKDHEFHNIPRIAVIGPKMYFPNKMIQHCGIAFHKDKMPGHIWWNKRKIDDPLVNKTRKFVAVTGGAMFVRRRIFYEMHGFDEVYKVCAYEDIDFCLRLKEKNYLVKYEPKSEILHHESITQKKFDPDFRQDYFVKNTATFLSRWRKKIKPDYFKMTYGEEE